MAFTIDRSKPYNVSGKRSTWFGICAKCGKKVRAKWVIGFLHECEPNG